VNDNCRQQTGALPQRVHAQNVTKIQCGKLPKNVTKIQCGKLEHNVTKIQRRKLKQNVTKIQCGKLAAYTLGMTSPLKPERSQNIG
jgi:hypothetical protein